MRTLLQDGARRVLQGHTTAEEVLRVTQESD
jgi:type II secretory ATPase GspE/PulE/Tfp pilus assembly ATPase PilB-like protein